MRFICARYRSAIVPSQKLPQCSACCLPCCALSLSLLHTAAAFDRLQLMELLLLLLPEQPLPSLWQGLLLLLPALLLKQGELLPGQASNFILLPLLEPMQPTTRHF